MPKSETVKELEVGDEKLYQELCNRFESHILRFEKHEMDEVKHFSVLIKAQQKNTEAISKLTESVSSLVKDTSSIIQLHKDFQSTARIGRKVQSFAAWLVKWGLIGSALAAGINWVIEYGR